MVESTGLENRRPFTRTVGSNPTPSATPKNVKRPAPLPAVRSLNARGPLLVHFRGPYCRFPGYW